MLTANDHETVFFEVASISRLDPVENSTVDPAKECLFAVAFVAQLSRPSKSLADSRVNHYKFMP